MIKMFSIIFMAGFFILSYSSLIYSDGPGKTYDVYTLWSDIKNDETVFKFDDPLTVTGFVVETGISRYATPYVSLSNEKGGTVYATCVLPRTDALKLKEFKNGEKVTISGNYYAFRDKAVIKKCRKL